MKQPRQGSYKPNNYKPTPNKYQQPRRGAVVTSTPIAGEEGILPQIISESTSAYPLPAEGKFITIDLTDNEYHYNAGSDLDLDVDFDYDMMMLKEDAKTAEEEEKGKPYPSEKKGPQKKGYPMPKAAEEHPMTHEEAFANAVNTWTTSYIPDADIGIQDLDKLKAQEETRRKVAESLGINYDNVVKAKVKASGEYRSFDPFKDQPIEWAPPNDRARSFRDRYMPEPVPDISDVAANDEEEVLVNIQEIADHYAQTELKIKFSDFEIEKYIEEYTEAYDRHFELITSFKRTKNV